MRPQDDPKARRRRKFRLIGKLPLRPPAPGEGPAPPPTGDPGGAVHPDDPDGWDFLPPLGLAGEIVARALFASCALLGAATAAGAALGAPFFARELFPVGVVGRLAMGCAALALAALGASLALRGFPPGPPDSRSARLLGALDRSVPISLGAAALLGVAAALGAP